MKADVFLFFFISIFSKNLYFTINSDVVFVLFWTVLKQRKQSEVVVFKLYTRMLLVRRLIIDFPSCGPWAKLSLTPLPETMQQVEALLIARMWEMEGSC